MDKQQYDIACEIVDQDCTLTGSLKDGKGNFCVIGGLYTAIDPDWAEAPMYTFDPKEQSDIYRAVAAAFDIDVDPLWMANDDSTTIGYRREHVKEELFAQLEEYNDQ